MTATEELPQRRRALAWFGGVGSALAWGLHLGIVYWYAEFACNTETAVASVDPVVIGLTVVLGAAAVAAGVTAAVMLRDVRRGTLPDPRERLRFMAIAGVIASVVFTFAIVLEGVQVLAFETCTTG